MNTFVIGVLGGSATQPAMMVMVTRAGAQMLTGAVGGVVFSLLMVAMIAAAVEVEVVVILVHRSLTLVH